MRIAFVTPYNEQYAGIFAHTEARLKEWRNQGNVVERWTYHNGDRAASGAARNFLADAVNRRSLYRSLSIFRPDVIVLRWLYAAPFLIRLLTDIAPVVLEIHADDRVERQDRGVLRTVGDRMFRKLELTACSGAYFMNESLAASESFRLIPEPRVVLGGGLEVRPRTVAPKRDLVGMAVAGVNPWQGLDRFGGLAASVSEIPFEVACPKEKVSHVTEAVSNKSVRVVGTESQEEYLERVSSWSLAIGSMALERSGRLSARALKVRDYLGLGVPTVIPYWEDDISNRDIPFVWTMSAGPSLSPRPVTPAMVRSCLESARGHSVPPSAVQYLDVASTELRRIEFLRDVVGVCEASR